MPISVFVAVCLAGLDGDAVLSRKLRSKGKEIARLQKITKRSHFDFGFKVTQVSLLQFLRWHEFIFRGEHMLLKCRMLSHVKTSPLRAFQSFSVCTDLSESTGG